MKTLMKKITDGLWMCLVIPYAFFCLCAMAIGEARQAKIDRKHGEGEGGEW
jgi:hypothetical protein